MKRAIRTHLKDFAAIAALVLLSIVVAGYVLVRQGLRLPFVESSQFTLNAELSTAQAVTPGQGQSVRVSGVQIGDIGGVTLRNGIALVRMDIDSQYRDVVHRDWTALLRPRTGLKDMFIELSPPAGGSRAPVAPRGYTIPVANTLPDVNLDEILASLDADSRAYLALLVNGAGRGLANGGGDQLAQVLERFEPTHRDLARVSTAVARRSASLRRLVNSLQRLNTALAAEQSQIVQLVNAGATVFRAFASEDRNVSRAVAQLPGTLSQTTAALGQVRSFAATLGPAARSLLPAARALPAADDALAALARPSAPIVQHEIRPFVVAARPVVEALSPAAVDLADATPNLRKTFAVLNHLVNMLGYSPGGGQHGYLWWLAWLGHNTRTLFSVQDANGPYRPVFIQFSCAQVSLLTSGELSLVGTLLGLAPLRAHCGLPAARQTSRAQVG
jgi:phospholipid/cholesterol/gamma-HCH transport system substrate-binding protein